MLIPYPSQKKPIILVHFSAAISNQPHNFFHPAIENIALYLRALIIMGASSSLTIRHLLLSTQAKTGTCSMSSHFHGYSKRVCRLYISTVLMYV